MVPRGFLRCGSQEVHAGVGGDGSAEAAPADQGRRFVLEFDIGFDPGWPELVVGGAVAVADGALDGELLGVDVGLVVHAVGCLLATGCLVALGHVVVT